MANERVRAAGDYALAKTIFGITNAFGLLPIGRALELAASIGRRVGPRTGRHRVVMDNLRLAMPELSEAERQEIATEMWGHQARLVVEAAYPNRIFDLSPGSDRIEVTGLEHIAPDLEAGRPILFFTGHTGCFEFLPAVGVHHDFAMATLFRPPNNRYVAERLLAQREMLNGLLIPASWGAAVTLRTELRAGRSVGLLVDQKFRAGPMVDFFGHPAPTNPLVVKLSESTDRKVVPARCIRLPGNRYRVAVEKPLALVRRPSGKMDVEASLRLVNGTVERWVREYPEQWMWFHRRWG